MRKWKKSEKGKIWLKSLSFPALLLQLLREIPWWKFWICDGTQCLLCFGGGVAMLLAADLPLQGFPINANPEVGNPEIHTMLLVADPSQGFSCAIARWLKASSRLTGISRVSLLSIAKYHCHCMLPSSAWCQVKWSKERHSLSGKYPPIQSPQMEPQSTSNPPPDDGSASINPNTRWTRNTRWSTERPLYLWVRHLLQYPYCWCWCCYILLLWMATEGDVSNVVVVDMLLMTNECE